MRTLLLLLTLASIAGCKPEPPQAKPIAEVPGVAPREATTTPSGLAYQVLEPGAGDERPTLRDRVRVEYLSWSTKGPFDSQNKSGGSEIFDMNGVIAGWTEALLEMRVGERRRLWLPDKLAYPNLRANPTTWVFELELLEIVRGQQPLAAPDDALTTPRPEHPCAPKLDELQLAGVEHLPEPSLAPAPQGAKRTKSGLAYRFQKKGEGGAKATLDDRVVISYCAWTSEGKFFDSSTLRGKPSSLPLRGLIPGWAEGLQLMAKGDKATFWIPEQLAYGGKAGGPAGMLVYEVELHDIVARRTATRD